MCSTSARARRSTTSSTRLTFVLLAALSSAGLALGEQASFYLGPPGQHDQLPLGGDAHHDEGTRDAGPGAVTGSAIGGVALLAEPVTVRLGLAAIAVLGGIALVIVQGRVKESNKGSG